MKYKELIESLLENFLADIEMSPDQFAKVMATDSDMTGSAKDTIQNAAKSISAAEDYLLFRSMMTEENLKLEAEVLRMLEADMQANSTLPQSSSAGIYSDVHPPQQGETSSATNTFTQSSMSREQLEEKQLQEALRISKEEYESSPKRTSDGFDVEELARALEASRVEYEMVQQRLKDQEAKTAAAMQTSLKGAPPLAKSKSKKDKKSKKSPVPSDPPKALPPLSMCFVKDGIIPPEELPPVSSTLSYQAATSKGWISEQAQAATGQAFQPAEGLGDSSPLILRKPSKSMSREVHFKQLREKLRQKNNTQRDESLAVFVESRNSSDAAKTHGIVRDEQPLESGGAKTPSPVTKKSESSNGPKLTSALALRLKQEVIKKSN